MEEVTRLTSSTPCIHCGHSVENNFCSLCGQRASIKRLSFREGWNDFWARIYGFDGMFPRTLRDLTLRPGLAAKKYIEGNRVLYYGPVGYFFLMITLMYLVASLLNINLVDFLKANDVNRFQTPPPQGSGLEQVIQYMFQRVSDNMKLISFVMIAIQAFCARYLFFRASSYNYMEHMVLSLYTQGHIYWLSVISLMLFPMTGQFMPSWIPLIISIVYISYSYTTMFDYQSKVKSFLNGIGIFISIQILFAMLIGIVVVLVIVFDSEVYEMIRPSNNR